MDFLTKEEWQIVIQSMRSTPTKDIDTAMRIAGVFNKIQGLLKKVEKEVASVSKETVDVSKKGV